MSRFDCEHNPNSSNFVRSGRRARVFAERGTTAIYSLGPEMSFLISTTFFCIVRPSP